MEDRNIVVHFTFDPQNPRKILKSLSGFVISRCSAEQLIRWINGLPQEEEELFRALNACSGDTQKRQARLRSIMEPSCQAEVKLRCNESLHNAEADKQDQSPGE
nr:V2 [Soybean stay-green associated virus]